MGESSRSRAGQIGSDIAMILVTGANLVFITSFYEYIAWYTLEPGGGVTRLSILTDDYFVWLPIPIAASILAIAAYSVMMFYDRYWLRTTAQILLSVIGVAIVTSLLSVFPFDFSVIPNATVVEVAPRAVTVFLVLMAVIYGATAVVMLLRLIRSLIVKRETG